MPVSYICCKHKFILQILLLCPAAGAREMQRRRRRRERLWLRLRGVLGGGPVGRAGGQSWAAPRGRHTLANQHELASNEECTRTYCCRACCNDTGTAATRLAGMDPAEICTNMQEICKEYAVICEKYAQNMRTYTLY